MRPQLGEQDCMSGGGGNWEQPEPQSCGGPPPLHGSRSTLLLYRILACLYSGHVHIWNYAEQVR